MLMVLLMMDNGKGLITAEKASIHIQMKVIMKETLLITKDRAMVF